MSYRSFYSESTLCSDLNIKEFFARNKYDTWSSNDRNGIRTCNHLVRKWTLNHLTKLTKWLSCVLSTYRYGSFDFVLLSCHIRVMERIYSL